MPMAMKALFFLILSIPDDDMEPTRAMSMATVAVLLRKALSSAVIMIRIISRAVSLACPL